MNKNFILSGLVLFSFFLSYSQPNWDTTKYLKYKDRLVVATYYSYRQFDYDFKQKMVNDSGRSQLHYLADANSVLGLELSYDKISFSLGLKSTPHNDTTKGKTTFRNFALSFGGNKFIIEASYRNYKGFYDDNTVRYDSSFNTTKVYYQNSSMQVQQVKGKFMYFTNHKKFSYKSSYSSTHRQLKSAFSWILGGNVYSTGLRSDTSFVPHFVREAYGNDGYLQNLRVTAISAGAGASLNLVLWKRFFANATFVLYCEPQWRHYTYLNGTSGQISAVSASGDARVAFGYNARNFFITFNSNNDFVMINTKRTEITSKFISGAFTIGYRFRANPPGYYRKFQETRIYKML